MKLTPSGYRPRLWDSLLGRRFAGFGAVEVAGTKCIYALSQSLRAELSNIFHFRAKCIANIFHFRA